MYLEFEGSSATKHDLPAGDVLRQAAHATDMVSGAQVLVLVYLTDFVHGSIPKTLTLFLQSLLEIRSTMNAAHPRS